ncbi:MAG: DUF6788 family protein [Elusimicrobiota bacterium]
MTATNLLISRARQDVERLTRELSYHANRILKANLMTKGSIYIQKKKCGHPNCKCASGNLHTAPMLSMSYEGRTRHVPLTKYSVVERMEIEKRAKEYQKFRYNRAKVVSYFKQLITAVNTLEQGLLIEAAPKKPGARNEK